MKGHVRNIVFGKPYGFIKASTGLDNIFIHKDNYHGDWTILVLAVTNAKGSSAVKVQFELEEGKDGPRAAKCSYITATEYKELE